MEEKKIRNLIRLMPETEHSTCERPEQGAYIIQKMDTVAFEPHLYKEDEYFYFYSQAISRYNDIADMIIAKKTDYNWVFIAKRVGAYGLELLEEFGVR